MQKRETHEDEKVMRDMQGLVDALRSTQIATKPISYKDVAGSFRKYKGDNSQDVNVWLEAFDKIRRMANWNDFETFLNLKKSLEDAVLDVVDVEAEDYESARRVHEEYSVRNFLEYPRRPT